MKPPCRIKPCTRGEIKAKNRQELESGSVYQTQNGMRAWIWNPSKGALLSQLRGNQPQRTVQNAGLELSYPGSKEAGGFYTSSHASMEDAAQNSGDPGAHKQLSLPRSWELLAPYMVKVPRI